MEITRREGLKLLLAALSVPSIGLKLLPADTTKSKPDWLQLCLLDIMIGDYHLTLCNYPEEFLYKCQMYQPAIFAFCISTDDIYLEFKDYTQNLKFLLHDFMHSMQCYVKFTGISNGKQFYQVWAEEYFVCESVQMSEDTTKFKLTHSKGF